LVGTRHVSISTLVSNICLELNPKSQFESEYHINYLMLTTKYRLRDEGRAFEFDEKSRAAIAYLLGSHVAREELLSDLVWDASRMQIEEKGWDLVTFRVRRQRKRT
jgi:hypothetical protein